MLIFFLGIPFFEKCILRGLGSRKAHHFWKMEGIDLAKVGSHWYPLQCIHFRIFKIKYISASPLEFPLQNRERYFLENGAF